MEGGHLHGEPSFLVPWGKKRFADRARLHRVPPRRRRGTRCSGIWPMVTRKQGCSPRMMSSSSGQLSWYASPTLHHEVRSPHRCSPTSQPLDELLPLKTSAKAKINYIRNCLKCFSHPWPMRVLKESMEVALPTLPPHPFASTTTPRLRPSSPPPPTLETPRYPRRSCIRRIR